MIKRLRTSFLPGLILAISANTVAADDAYYHLSLNDLQITQGKLPQSDEAGQSRWWRIRDQLPYARLDGDGEVYVRYELGAWQRGENRRTIDQEIAVRVPRAREVTGLVFLPKWDGEGMQRAAFKISADKTTSEAEREFYKLKMAHYEKLMAQDAAGGAWFRHQVRQARRAMGAETKEIQGQQTSRRRGRANELADTYALFTGGRAMSENLQLDRVLQPASRQGPLVKLEEIEGITVREIDWKPLMEGLDPQLDPLAHKIPADQHAVFFPSFEAAVAVADEFAKMGTPILQLAEPQSTSARTFERYQEQMCLTISQVARLVGPALVNSVAVTGSDPYFRTGTDVAVLFETEQPAALTQMLLAQVGLAASEHEGTQLISGEVRGLDYRGAKSEARRISCYVAKTDGLVIVTNSPHQLERLVEVTGGAIPALASLDEYAFFRHRYPRGAEEETAFLFLSDATIRRWCGPRWRIATSRRLRDAAVLAELQASQMELLVAGNVETGRLYTDLPIGGEADLKLTAQGVQGATIGSLAFMTPIAEMEFEHVTQAEAEAYRRWRDRYQNNWRWAFDPIGLRLRIQPDLLAGDLTVMPLIWGSDYRQIIAYSQGAAFEPDAGDQHDTLAHAIIAIDTDSPELRRQTNLLRTMTGSAQLEPLSWLGNNVSIYADKDPFWERLAQVVPDEVDELLEEEGWRLPVAVRADVSSGLKLSLFLAGVRGFIEQSAPAMLNWENLTYHDQPYVKITPTERAVGRTEQVRNLAIYYSASGKSFTLTTNEDVLKRAMEREVARGDDQDGEGQDGGDEPASERPGWIGSNLALQIDQQLLQVLASLGREQYQRRMQELAWSNLPILNEWKLRFDAENPGALHEQFWQVRLLCPGGGQYVWNEHWKTMESTVYGSPAEPRTGPVGPDLLRRIERGNFGLTFEEQGLRARVELAR
jgi:hypothetical protein